MITGSIVQRGGVSGGLTAGVGGTTDYNELENRPSINGNILEGNKTGQQLGLLEWGSVVANPDVTGQAIRPLNYIEIKGEYYKPPEPEIPIISEIIQIGAGNNTNSRTFTFSKTPKFVAYYWNDPLLENSGWNTTAHFIWGQELIVYNSAMNVVSISNNYQGCLRATYNGNSVTFTGGNSFSVCNTPNGTGLFCVIY